MVLKKYSKQVLINLGFINLLQLFLSQVTKVKNETIHLFCEVVYRFPNPVYKFNLLFTSRSNQIKKATNDLHNEGFTILYEFLDEEQLEKLKSSFTEMSKVIEGCEPGPIKLSPFGGLLHPQVLYPEQAFDQDSQTTFSNNPFKYSREFLEVALNCEIITIIGGYIGKKFMLQQSTAARCYPLNKTNFGSWQWHHDSWGKKVNVMVLLSDVTEADQYMSYMKFSHKIYHSFERTAVNDRFTEEEVLKLGVHNVVKCIGKAGTIFIFDANGFHRGNRNLGATRDVLINQYTAGRYLWPLGIPEKFLINLNTEQVKFLKQNPHIEILK